MLAETLLEARDLTKTYKLPHGLGDRLLRRAARAVHALNGVSFAVDRGETLGLIGESGCGKTTLGRTLLRLHEPSSGAILFEGRNVADLDEAELRAARRRLQIIFQDPYASLNPRATIEDIVGLPLRIHEKLPRREVRDRVAALIERVGLRTAHLRRYPHQFSGGQRQRIGIARALILRPSFVVCDEPVSALDVSIQAQIIALLQELKSELGLTYLFISHDISVVAYISNRIAVMYLGEIVELGSSWSVVESPRHPYTQALLSAVPGRRRFGGERMRLAGDIPSPLAPPAGCKFHTRCPSATEHCRRIKPMLREIAPGEHVACHLYGGAP